MPLGPVGQKHWKRHLSAVTQPCRDEAYFWASKAKEKEMHRTLGRIRDDLAEDEQKGLADFDETG